MKATGGFRFNLMSQRGRSLGYDNLYDTAESYIFSFLDMLEPRPLVLIPEIVHSGLRLYYRVETGKAYRFLNGARVRDLDVLGVKYTLEMV